MGLEIILEQNQVEHSYTSRSEAKQDGWTSQAPSNPSAKYDDDTFMWSYILIGSDYMWKKNPDPSDAADPAVDDEDPAVDDKVKVDKKVEISQRMSEMFDVFRVFDREGTNLIKKLKEQDREIIKSRATKRITDELGDNIVDNAIVDDTFVQYLINYMVVDKNMDPFVIDYIPTSVYKLSYELVESIGLAKVLSEQGFTTNSEKVYIQYTDGDNFKLIGGPGAKNQAAYEYNRKTGQPVSGPEEPVKSPEPQQSEEPEKRPEDEMGIRNKKLLNDIYKKASDEGIEKAKDLIQKHFSPRQKEILGNMNFKGYALVRPVYLDLHEFIDVKAEFPDEFKDFDEFKMYRLKTTGVDVKSRDNAIIELSKLVSLTKGQCKELIDLYHEMGSDGQSDFSKEELKFAANQVYNCKRKYTFGKFDFRKTKDKLDDIGSTRWAQDNESTRFTINWNNKTVGTGDVVIEL